ncbi:MAG: DUF1801 domain-containing protein [Chitinophagaceae bacterium]
MKPADNYFQQQEEPVKSCLLALRQLVLAFDGRISEAWKYGMPMYCIQNKMCCYLWVHKKFHQPYLGIVEGGKIDHPLLLQEKRARMKILLIDPEKDIPVKTIEGILKKMVALYPKK